MENVNRGTTHRNNSRGSVLVLAPRGQDGDLAATALGLAEILAESCGDLLELARRFSEDTNALLIAEEALVPQQLPALLEPLRTQPPWSDIPVIILSTTGGGDRTSVQVLEIFGPAANVSLLERPLRSVTLVAAVRAALRARRRQREVRQLIVEREIALETISHAKEQAEEANRAKDQFLAMLSHELRTPLTPVLMMVSALQGDRNIPGELQANLEILRRNIELEALLIDDLLDLTRISHGKLQLNPEAIDVHACIEHALAISATELKQKRIRVSKEFTAERHRSLADPARLEQAFWNIIKNAVKFTPAGGELHITTHNRSDFEEILVEFTDSGIGIDSELAPRIFDAFEQGGRTVTNRYGGLGLGLAICKRVVEMHGGEISVRSEGANRGATFSVVLKTIHTHPVDNSVRPVENLTPSEPADILLVEDHADTAQIMRYMLERSGYRVSHAPDCAHARDLARVHAFDLIISDLGLPDGNGLDLMRELRNSHRLEGIALSGFGMESDVAAAKEAGFVEHLTKPVDLGRLNNAIDRLLSRRRDAGCTSTAAALAL